jgi:hypothetical protein
MKYSSRKSRLLGSICLSLCLAWPSYGQQSGTGDADSFTSENAILDTSILFAIGAREARQELRGSFGWPTFQEGLVEGVYFRFDPDGYARFSPSARLDKDVFEVICRPRTSACIGRKNGLAVALTSRGTLQLRMENIVETDQFFVADGITELQLPQNILHPLDPRLELLLSSGGELVIKRRDAEADRISLVGFAAVAAFLRWVSAGQDYVVLPRDWPVPNAPTSTTALGLTQVANWQSPMPQPIFPQPTESAEALANAAQISEIAETSKNAFELLKEIAEPVPQQLVSQSVAPAMTPVLHGETASVVQIQELQTAIATLMVALEAHSRCNSGEVGMITGGQAGDSLLPGAETAQAPTQGGASGVAASQPSASLSARLEYLIEEIGLPSDLALALVQQSEGKASPATDGQPNVVSEILTELKTQLMSENASPPKEEGAGDTLVVKTQDPQEFQLLSDYFKSISQ